MTEFERFIVLFLYFGSMFAVIFWFISYIKRMDRERHQQNHKEDVKAKQEE